MSIHPVFVGLVVWLLLMLPVGNSVASVDVVLALDRSLSMNNNDPGRDSLKGAALFGELLSHADRLSVMTFAQDGRALLPLTRLSDRDTLDRISALIGGIKMDGVRTDFSAALRVGHQALAASRDDPEAKRILVFFTDGQLNLGNDAATQAARAEILEKLIPRFQAAGIQIHGVAFSAEADLGFLRLLTESTGGQAFKAEKPEDIYLAFVKLFEQADHPLTAPMVDGKVEVDANVHELKLLVQREAGDAPTRLTDPSQREWGAADKRPGVDWRSTAHFDHITIQQPEAGAWRITADSQEKRAYLESDLDLEAHLPILASVGEPVGVTARLTYRGGDVDPKLSSSTRFTATVLDEAGAIQQEIDLQPDTASQPPGPHRGSLSFPEPGSFQVRVAGEGQGFQRGKVYSISLMPAGQRPAGPSAPLGADASNRRSALAIILMVNLILAAIVGVGAALWWWRRRGRDRGDDSDIGGED